TAVTVLADWLLPRVLDGESAALAIGLWAENSPEWIIADLALWHCSERHRGSIAAVPLPGFFSAGQLAHVQRSTAMRWLLLAEDCDSSLPVVASWATPIAGLRLARLADPTDAVAPSWAADTVKISFTSGTSGQPKGVCLPAALLDEVIGALARRIQSGLSLQTLAPHLNLLPLSTLLENLAGVGVPLLLGRPVIALPGAALGLQGSSGLDPAQLLQALHQHQPGSLILLPQLLQVLVQMRLQGLPLPESLRFLAVGGGVTSAQLLAQAEKLGLPVYQGYGLSECASVVSLNAPAANRCGSVGQPLDHVQVRVVDGRIEVRTAVPTHYLGDAPGAGPQWLDTGDLGEFDAAGFLHVSGRAKHLLISSFGRNIAPEWVESELALCPAVAQAIVIGDARPWCAALIVPRPGQAEALPAQLAELNARLPDYARIQQFRLVRPFSPADGTLTDNGRLRRDVIAAREAAQINDIYASTTHAQEAPMSFFQRLQAETARERDYLLASPLIRRCLDGDSFTLEEYIAFLSQAYHHVRHTVPLLMAAGSRLPPEQERYREAIAEYIEEEIGHQEWILNDIRACGADAEQVRHSQPAFATELMVSYAYDGISRGNPMCFFGMVFVLEGTSINLATAAAQIIQQRLGLPDRAFSYLRSHGSLDIKHMQFFEKLMDSVQSADDQAAIIHAARRFYVLYANIFRDIGVSARLQEAA
ncbi:MAG: AMP-binding protein, partial [Xanthomonadales bacterium]|nr:AMP-binding protein [Xanthomonadales bacterium]